MKRSMALALFFVTGTAITATPKKQADLFGWQLDCATTMALNAYNLAASETNRVRRAVDSCMSKSISNNSGFIRVSSNPTMTALEERRENLVEAVMRRLQMCRDTGIAAAKFASACPQLFTIEPAARD